MHNEFTAIIEKTVSGLLLIVRRFPALMDRDGQKVSVLKVFGNQ